MGQWGSSSLLPPRVAVVNGHKVGAENQALVPDADFGCFRAGSVIGPRAGLAGSAGGAVGHRKITVVCLGVDRVTAPNCRMSKSIPRERACDDLPRGW